MFSSKLLVITSGYGHVWGIFAKEKATKNQHCSPSAGAHVSLGEGGPGEGGFGAVLVEFVPWLVDICRYSH